MKRKKIVEAFSWLTAGTVAITDDSSGGYCEREYVVPRCCQSYGVGVLGLERECISINDYVDCRELVGTHEGCRPVHPCVLIAYGVFDDVRVERYAHRTHVPNAQSQIRGRVNL